MSEPDAEKGSDGSPDRPDQKARALPAGWRWGGFGVFLVFFTWLYFFAGTHLIYETNQDRLNWDQQHNISPFPQHRSSWRVRASIWQISPSSISLSCVNGLSIR